MGYASMDGEGRISDYRSRLDKTLSSPNLTDEEMVHTLVKNQILQTMDSELGEYTDRAIERRSKEVFKFLTELRSASSNDSHSGWKVKQDTEELRVMYREGPEGTPFHTLLAEGYVDGPVDVSDSERIERSTHGFTRDGIPDAQGVVRMDLYGGFALKKVTEDRSFFRTIANLDIKLDFVPPALINFVARQLVGSGFKLYKKEVASANGSIEVQEALKDPIYTRVRKALYKEDKALIISPVLKDTHINLEEAFKENTPNEENRHDESTVDSKATNLDASERTVLNEIEEFEEKGLRRSEGSDSEEIEAEVRTDKMEVNNTEVGRSHEITEHFTYGIKAKGSISPEVQRALGTLENAISIFRDYRRSPNNVQSDIINEDFLSSENDASKESISWEADEIRKRNLACAESSKLESTELIVPTARNSSENHGSRRSNSSARETNQSKIAPEEDGTSPSQSKHIDPPSSMNERNVAIISESMTKENLPSAEANRIKERNNKRLRFCCLSFGS